MMTVKTTYFIFNSTLFAFHIYKMLYIHAHNIVDNTIRSRVPCRNLTSKHEHEHTYKLPHRLTNSSTCSPYFHCSSPIVIHTTLHTNTSHSCYIYIRFVYWNVYFIYINFLYFVAGCEFS